MSKILNLVIEDWSDPKETKVFVESFQLQGDIKQPEQALRDAIKEFVNSGTEDAKKALESSCGCFNWGDAMSSVPDELFAKHGLIKLNQDAVDVFVDHDEILCDQEAYEAEDE